MMSVTKIIYKTRKILGINVSVPTGEKLVFDKKHIPVKWEGNNCNFVITYRYRYQYFLACPKEKIPKNGFIKIGKSILDMEDIHDVDDKREKDDEYFSNINLMPEDPDNHWNICLDHKKDIDIYIRGLRRSILKLVILRWLGHIELDIEVIPILGKRPLIEI